MLIHAAISFVKYSMEKAFHIESNLGLLVHLLTDKIYFQGCCDTYTGNHLQYIYESAYSAAAALEHDQ